VNDAVLVLNAGSSSIKFELFGIETGGLVPQVSGQIEGLGASPRLAARDAKGAKLIDQRFDDGAADHDAGLARIIAWLEGQLAGARVVAVGHRVVHGGIDFTAPVVVTDAVRSQLAALVPLAPLHQPHNLAGIDAAAARFPGVPQIACFDTAFHRAHPFEADTFALPPEFYARGIRRYGFHGLSYEYIARLLMRDDPAIARGRVVVAHLGNGASLCALQAGHSIESSMGFTALDGVPMGSRCGQIDPGVLLHLLDQGMGTAELSALLYGNSGLKGMSGISQDLRELEASDRPEAAAALSYFVHRLRREIGALVAVLGGIDALVFTAGIGENARNIRARICDGLGFLGIAIDPARNAVNEATLSPDGALVPVLLRRTDEERMIAEHVLALLPP
jgi:acetate kinase